MNNEYRKTNNYYQLKISETLEALDSSRNGLSEKEAKKRLSEFGFNRLQEKKPISAIKILLTQINNILVYIILAATAVSLFLHHWFDAIFISIVLFINIVVGFIQEYKAENTLRELKKLITHTVAVLRGGLTKQVNVAHIAVGDILVLKAGDIVPADARIIFADNLKVDEANLTGESYPVSKNRELIEKEVLYFDQKNMVFAGTSVVEGMGKAVVTATGGNTEFGKIAELSERTKKSKTPLQKKISGLALILGIIILVLVAIVFLLGLFSGHSIYKIFLVSVSLAVSAIPEALLPAITIVLAIGMRRMFKKKALVKRLSATETLGGITAICLDKTGTLTEGKMAVNHILAENKEKLLQTASLVGEAYIENPDDELSKWIVRGRPTDRALLEAAIESGISIKENRKRFKEISAFLFDSKNKYALRVFFDKKYEEYVLLALGAPEILLEKSGYFQVGEEHQPASETKIKELKNSIDEFAKKGLRVIACGEKRLGKKLPNIPIKDLFNEISFLGIAALKDPLRKDAAYAMRIALHAGIKPIIVTGDYVLTAKAIAKEIGFSAKKDEIFEGRDIDKINDDELAKIVAKTKIFARVSPQNKLRIVQALKENGEIVAMTGDGVNDAPALKMSDVGIALGSGTEVSKESADIILLDDNFKVIIDAIEEGRNIFENIRKVLVYLIADDSSEILLFFAALFFGLPLPLLPAQILWINIVEDGLPNIALTMDKKERGLMADAPRDPNEAILNSDIKKWFAVVAAASFFSALIVFVLFWKLTGDIARTQTVVFALMSVDSLVFAYSVRSFKKKMLRKDIFDNHFLNGSAAIGVVLLLALIYIPILQKFIQTVPLGIYEWGIIILLIFAEITVIDKFKIKILGE